MRFSSLRAKAFIWFAGAIVTVMCLFSFLLYYFIEENMDLRIQNNLYYSAKDMLDEIEEGNLEQISFKYEKANKIEAAIVKNKKIIKKTQAFDIENFHEYINKDKIFFIKESGEYTVDAVYVLNFSAPFEGSIVLNKKNLPDKAEDIEDILLVLNPLFLFILIFIGTKLINKILIPVENITKSAKQINIDNLTQEISTGQKEDEIKELVDTFNEMIKRLRTGVEKMDRFNNDVSHELRTPLTVINTQVELALKKDRDGDYYKNSLKKISDESNKMKQMVHDMLILTRYTKENIKETYTLCDLNSLLMDSVEKFSILADGKNITIEFRRFEKALFKGNCSLIAVVFSNLIDNAIKYSKDGKRIYLSIFTLEEKVIFIIEDEGIGIPKSSLDKVTDRFYRVDESRNKSIKGFGLGLSLVKNIVDLHSGSLQIDSKESAGTTVKITF